jgi:hypothetical protein
MIGGFDLSGARRFCFTLPAGFDNIKIRVTECLNRNGVNYGKGDISY